MLGDLAPERPDWCGQTANSALRRLGPGATIDLQVQLVNSSASPGPTSSFALTLPAGLAPVGNPPFVGSPPSGTSWDNATQTLSWSGTPPASGSVSVTFRVLQDAAQCSGDLLGSATISTCVGLLGASLHVAAVPVPPANALYALRTQQGFYYRNPAAPGGWTPLLERFAQEANGETKQDAGPCLNEAASM